MNSEKLNTMRLLKLPFWNYFKKVYSNGDETVEFTNNEWWIIAIVFFIVFIAVIATMYFAYCDVMKWLDKKRPTIVVKHGKIIDRSITDDEYFLIVESDDMYRIEVEMKDYYLHAVNDRVRFEVTTGGISKEVISIKLLQNG